jgi:pyruvyl transferase EpsO
MINYMLRLSSLLDEHAELVQGRVVLLDYPVHSNIGDLLIWKGEQVFLRRHKKALIGQYSIGNLGRKAKRTLKRCQTICLHGGGNFGDLWPWHQTFRENVISRYQDKRIIIFPQTVFYENAEGLTGACNLLKRHDDLHIMLRDEKSYSLLFNCGVPNLRLCPDMAHALWGRYSAPDQASDSLLYVLRDDKEQGYLPDNIKAVAGAAVDWNDLLKGQTAAIFNIGKRAVLMDGRYRNVFPACALWNIVADRLIRRAIMLLAPHRIIITNRLHAVILSALIGRQVVAYDNSYGKLASYAKCWLRDVIEVENDSSDSSFYRTGS